MTFMKKLMDMLNMDNWKGCPHDDKIINDTQNCSTSVFTNDTHKWLSIRDAKAMEIEKRTLDLKNITIYFDNGVISDVIPDVYSYYEAEYYNINGAIYDSYSIESISSIPIPDYSKLKPTDTPVYSLDYLLIVRASQERRKKNNELAYALLEKSLELMEHSQTIHNKNQILRIVNWLYEDGRLEEAKKKEVTLRRAFPYTFDDTLLHKNVFFKELQSCKELKTDYIFCSSHQGTCPECAKYQCRVYCISGKDKRLPKLPDIVYQYGGFHPGCRHSFHPFFLYSNHTINDYNLKEFNVFKHSNRPFVDDRTEYDKQLYTERLKKQRKRIESAHNKEIYYILKEKLPDAMPKSLSGFTKMKNANSKNYQEIVRMAREIGINIS